MLMMLGLSRVIGTLCFIRYKMETEKKPGAWQDLWDDVVRIFARNGETEEELVHTLLDAYEESIDSGFQFYWNRDFTWKMYKTNWEAYDLNTLANEVKPEVEFPSDIDPSKLKRTELKPFWKQRIMEFLLDSGKKVSKKGGVGGPVALASGYENTYPLPNRPE
ncbi:hypothetical protein C2W62_45960 [Candidatus Entotheonella serta]|nr:hypothetical protein C2W62_45960 [Candidatus Entotheonella serta]